MWNIPERHDRRRSDSSIWAAGSSAGPGLNASSACHGRRRSSLPRWDTSTASPPPKNCLSNTCTTDHDVPMNSGRERQRQLRQEYKRAERERTRASLPISVDKLAELVDHVDASIMRVGCDHTPAAAQHWSQTSGISQVLWREGLTRTCQDGFDSCLTSRGRRSGSIVASVVQAFSGRREGHRARPMMTTFTQARPCWPNGG